MRIPAHCCGVFSLKPSFGVIPQRGYLSHAGGGTTDVDINVFGPITRSADDLDLLLGVLAGPEPERAVGWKVDLPESDAGSLADLRIGTWLDDPASPIESEYAGMLRAAVDRIADAGGRVDDDRPPVDFAQQRELFVRMIVPAMAPSLPEEQAEASSGSHLAWLRAEEDRAALRRTWAEWFGGHDLLLLPVVTVAAFPHDHDPDMWNRTIEIDGRSRSLVSTIDWLGLIGIVGLPSAVVPIGRTAEGSRWGCRSWRPTSTTAARLERPSSSAPRWVVTRCRQAFEADLMWSHQLPSPGGDAMHPDDRYVVISADCHGGGEIHEYRDFLASQYHDEFDAWVDGYQIMFSDLLGDLGKRNWDSERRMRDLEADGIVAEVIFPNTIPPFFPGGALGHADPPADAHDLELRWAGLQAHNRWLADFCARTPGRRAGVAQILLHDVDAHGRGDPLGARQRAAPAGSSFPARPRASDCSRCTASTTTRSGRCARSSACPSTTTAAARPATRHGAGRHRDVPARGHVVVAQRAHQPRLGGALERHPDLQFVFTEQGTAWVPDFLGQLDYFFDRMLNAVGSQEREWGLPVVEKMSLKPSEYWARQCHIGASFIRPSEVPIREQVGVDRIMWGSDYPHKESSHPFSKEAIRLSFAGVDPAEVQMMLAGNAAALYGFDLDALRPLAKGIGPLVEEVARPLSPADFPEGRRSARRSRIPCSPCSDNTTD